MVELYSESNIKTKYNTFKVYVFREDNRECTHEHVALVRGPIQKHGELVRVHSECLTGDVFGSQRCDCGPQLELAFKLITRNKGGMIIYLAQEGRGIGLGNKIKAYALQDRGYDTVEANKMLGFHADERSFKIAAQMLRHFGIRSVKLITNNPKKISDLERNGIKVEERIACIVKPNRHNVNYIASKIEKLGHFIDSNKLIAEASKRKKAKQSRKKKK